MNILVINAGSSSIKYKLFDMPAGAVLARGGVERIGLAGANLVHRAEGKPDYTLQADMPDHVVAMRAVLDALTDPHHGVVRSMSEIAAVGHRVVQGGAIFTKAALLTPENIAIIEDLCDLAPLHNPPALMGVQACMQVMPQTPMTAVFDTAFHQTMPAYAYTYPVPIDWQKNYRVRRYGAHGTSHQYVSGQAAKLLGKPVESLRTVTCHLGNGSSITAVSGGKSVDTSMGLTPLAGIIMGTRSGDIDPAVVQFIMGKTGMTVEQVTEALNKQSGLWGVVEGLSSDMRDITAAADGGNEQAQLAIDIFCYQVRKFIGAYAAAMGGLDCVVFTAGIAENTPFLRKRILEGLEFLGLSVDDTLNDRPAGDYIISPPGARVAVCVVATDEEKVIAQETMDVISQ